MSNRRPAIACVAVCAAAFLAAPAAARVVPSFYTVAKEKVAGAPGSIVRRERLRGFVPRHATASRIVYRSTGLRGEPVVVSGVVVEPSGPVPSGGRPVVAWQHPTSGVTRPCAPSLAPSVLRMVQGLPEMLSRGYIVVATDYPGLGTAGPHPYLAGMSEGRAVLDAVRAARNVSAGRAGERFIVWGHSQGGHATLYAALQARDYAPELRLAGVAAAAPATELAALSKGNPDSPDIQLMSAMLMSAWARIYDASLEQLIAPADMPAVALLARQCFDPPFDSVAQPREKPLPSPPYKRLHELDEVEPWRSLLARNTPGTLPPDVPVFLAQGNADTTIAPGVTADYMKRLCAAGSKVRMVVMPGTDHRFAARDSAKAAVEWMSDRFEGRPVPSDCRE